MRARYVFLVARRHVRELVRERRTVLGLVLVPLIGVIVTAIAREEIAIEVAPNGILDRGTIVHRVGVSDLEGARRLAAFLERSHFTLVHLEDPRRALAADDVPVALEVPPDLDRALARGERREVRILTARRTLPSQVAQAALAAALERYDRRIVARRLERAGLPASATRPLVVSNEEIAGERERAGSFLADLLPFMIVAQVFSLMVGIAIDATAGEKERRTIEALLATPLRRREILAAKCLVVAATGILAGSLTLTATMISFRATVGSLGGVPASAVALAVAGLIALALSGAALQITLGVLARSVQQAGVFVGPSVVLVFLPIALFMGQGGAAVGVALYGLPLVGPVLLVRYGIASSAAGGALPVAVLSSLAYAAALLVAADRLFAGDRALRRV